MKHGRWSVEKANEWYRRQPWLVGCNFLPSTAINQLEMWQAESFDPATIGRELGWAGDLGFNTVRVYLHDLVWSIDPVGFLERIDRFLSIADPHGIRTVFVLFDDCHFSEPRLGKQPDPIPGVHNSGWKQSPGEDIVLAFHDGSVAYQERVRLQGYVQGVLRRFADDKRVLMWDLYNEPGERTLGDRTAELLTEAWRWARESDPSQPLTSAVDVRDHWAREKDGSQPSTAGVGKASRQCLTAIHESNSDVMTFHCYGSPEHVREWIEHMRVVGEGKPVVCSEYLLRHVGCLFQTHMPIFKKSHVGCISWGLVAGKSQTIWPWSSRTSKRGPHEAEPSVPPEQITGEPGIWFHDIFRVDGTPYDPQEVAFIREITGRRPRGLN